ncbi:hypothetical protein [Azohydromonas australica]|uniref:hypothetical protein n=1 Tax=Azohydromonas australica TaxID=364039 RepID=UPI0012EB90BC|nr:hypothetical protein [Azohydromonas australica]
MTIPDGVEFADLRLSQDAGDGQVRFKIASIEAICEASDLDLGEILQGPQPLVGLLIAAWYAAHLARGGAPDPVQTLWKRPGSRMSMAAASRTRPDTPDTSTPRLQRPAHWP